MRQVVVNADDFGICEETNCAIEVAYGRGILTSASLMPNGPAFDHAVARTVPACPGLGVGIHLVLTTGRALSDPATVPLLVDRRGHFRRHFAGILALSAGPRSADACRQIELELSAQFERVTRAGIRIDHVDSHQYVHMIPAVWRIVTRLAARAGCAAVRLGSPPAGSQASRRSGSGLKGSVIKRVVLAACAVPARRLTPAQQSARGLIVRHPDRLATSMDRDGMDRQRLARELHAMPEGITEIVTHPSLASVSTVATLADSLSREDLMFLSSPARRLELQALMDPDMRVVADRRGIRLTSFGALSPDLVEASRSC